MREDIKERIEMIKRGKVPEGYKKTKVGIVPEEWEADCFGEIIEVHGGLVNPRIKPYIYMLHIGPENIEKNIGTINDIKTAEELKLKSGKYLFDKDSIIYSKVRPNLNKVCIPTFEGICSADCYAIHVNKNRVSKYYVYLYMLSELFCKQAVACSMRTKMPKINQDELVSFKIVYPCIAEQNKVVEILLKYDNKIELQQLLINEKLKQKNWLMQNLLTGKKRLKGFEDDWKKVKLGNIITEIDEKTTQNNQYEILSVTKNGIFKQSQHFNKQIASENNCGYKVLRKNNLVFSTMNLWMGSLDVLRKYDVGIVSPAYKVFEFKDKHMLSIFGEFFMKSSYMIWIYNINSEQGASIVRKNLDLSGLLNTYIKIPSIEEQHAIAKILSQTDKEIELLQQLLEQSKLEKKAMMQLLLTGIVRVNEKGGE